MPDVSGPFSEPLRGDSEQWLHTTLMQVLAQQEVLARQQDVLTQSLADLVEQLTEVAQAASPDRPRRGTNPRRRGRRSSDTPAERILKVVRVALVAVLCMGAVLALMAPRHLQPQRYTPRCTVACARPVAQLHNDHDADDR